MSESRLYMMRRLRAMSPQFVRTLYRLSRSFGPQPQSLHLPEALVSGCHFCASRVAMLDLLPKHGCYCEVGTYRGDFAREIVKHCQPETLHLIDIDYTYFVADGLSAGQVVRHHGHSAELLAKFSDETFDCIYVDGDHAYDAVIGDARAGMSKLKPGGYMVFNDFAHIDPFLGRYGVHRAAVEFAIEAQWPVRFFAFEPNALYDIALQRPPANTGTVLPERCLE